MLMARQIKLRRDQQKAKKAQQVVDDIEQSVRQTIDLDIPSLKSLKKPQKLQNKKLTSLKQRKLYSLVDATQLKARIDGRQEMNNMQMDTNEENQRKRQLNNLQQNVAIPMPLHPFFGHQNGRVEKIQS